jgi:uncharacterized protein YndB with AHSA1/START domain
MAIGLVPPVHGKTYHFVTTWEFDHSQDKVWAALNDPARWPEWWQGLARSQVAPGAKNEPGAVIHLRWRAPIGYVLVLDLTLLKTVPLELVEFSAAGDLVGTGSTKLTATTGSTKVTIDWNVATTKAWMNRLAVILDPIFSYNHTLLMAAGERGLKEYLSRQKI